MSKQITLTAAEITDLFNKMPVVGYEGWSIETDTSSGHFDAEKGAMYDYDIYLYDSDGSIMGIGQGGYYTGPTGEVFNYGVTFEPEIPEESEDEEILVKTIVWYGGHSNGDGSCGLSWFLTEEEADRFDEEGEGCECTGHVETFIGSDIHNEAVENSNLEN